MVLIYCTLLSAASGPLPPKVERSAHVTITILQPHRAGIESWNPSARRDQKEIVKKERDGTRHLLRVTEFE